MKQFFSTSVLADPAFRLRAHVIEDVLRRLKLSSRKNWCLTLCAIAATLLAPTSVHADEEEKSITPEDVKLGRPVEFERDIYPILQASCIACHNKAKSEGELNLEDAAAIMKGGDAGPSIVPGNPEESYFYQVAARIEESQMPPWPNEVQAKKLTPRQVGLLKQWILEGARAGAAASAANMQWQTINSQLTAIYSVDADPFGRFVAAGRAGTVNIYDLIVQDDVASLIDPALVRDKAPSQTAHRDYVHAIAFHPEGQMLATSGFQVVKLWSRDIDSTIAPIALPNTTVRTVTSADSTLAAVHQADGVIRVIDLSTNAVVSEIPGNDPAAITLLGVNGPENQWVSVGTADGIVKLINRADAAVAATSGPLGTKTVEAVFVAAGNKLVVLQEDGALRPLIFDAGAKTLVAAEPVKSDKGAIRQISLAGTTLLCRIEGQAVELRKTDSLKPAINISSGTALSHAAVSTDAKRVVTVTIDGRPELWNAADGKLLATLNADLLAARTLVHRTADKTVRDARVTVVKAQITEDEKRVTEQKASLTKAEEELKKATASVTEAKKSFDETIPKTAAAKKASEEKPEDAALKKALEAALKAEQTAKDAVTTADNALKSANKGKQLSEQAIKRAEARVAERKQLLAAVEQEAKTSTESQATSDAAAKQTITSQFAGFIGTSFVATVDNAGTTRLWKNSDGSAVDVFPAALPEAAKPVSVAGGVKGLLLQQADGQVARVNAFPQWKLKQILGPQGEGQPSAFADRVLALAFSPDGTTLAVGGGEASRSGELTLWNVADGKLVRTFEDAHSDTVYGVDFSGDGKLLASAAADKFVKVFELSTGKHVRSYEGHTHHVMDVSWKGDRTALASAGADNAIKVWNAETGEQSRTITTYKKQVTSLSFIGMEDEFISCSGDKRVFRHRAGNGGTVREFKGCPDYVYCSATTADGAIVAAGCEDGVLRVWNGKDAKEIASFAPVAN
ncbi:MAG: hypothetical protein GY903_19535 [Fuerstiella sp.]|nr:hypothetical protein [Fuerstiella sp.]MCP4856679.1 hypothetical protein [Fuerstiella sp.]